MFWYGYHLSKELSGPTSARQERRSFGHGKKGKATAWKLFHLEERPAFQRNIIDPSSEWTREIIDS